MCANILTSPCSLIFRELHTTKQKISYKELPVPVLAEKKKKKNWHWDRSVERETNFNLTY